MRSINENEIRFVYRPFRSPATCCIWRTSNNSCRVNNMWDTRSGCCTENIMNVDPYIIIISTRPTTPSVYDEDCTRNLIWLSVHRILVVRTMLFYKRAYVRSVYYNMYTCVYIYICGDRKRTLRYITVHSNANVCSPLIIIPLPCLMHYTYTITINYRRYYNMQN